MTDKTYKDIRHRIDAACCNENIRRRSTVYRWWWRDLPPLAVGQTHKGQSQRQADQSSHAKGGGNPENTFLPSFMEDPLVEDEYHAFQGENENETIACELGRECWEGAHLLRVP